MKPDPLFSTPQPRSVWILTTSLLGVALLCIFISHNDHHIVLYIDAFLFFIDGIVNFIFKCIEIRNLHRNKRKILWFHHTFWKQSGFPSLCIAAALLGYGLVLKGNDVLMLITGLPVLIIYLYIAVVQVRRLMTIIRRK